MKLPKFAVTALLGTLLLAVPGDRSTAAACGWSSSVETFTQMHPDLPFDAFAAGQLGLIQPGYARSYLVVAYRHLEGIGLDATEQRGALELWGARLGQGTPREEADAPWRGAVQKTLGSDPGAITTSFVRNYADVENCLPDAFARAASTLEARATQYGAKSAEVQTWVEGQNAVFANCTGNPTNVPALHGNHSATLRADRNYQQAAALFYAGQLVEAEREFRAIASDKTSAWRTLARYLVIRCLARQAILAGPTPSRPELLRAEGEARSLLADPAAAAMHDATRSYLQFLRVRTDPSGLRSDLSVQLASQRFGATFHRALNDYTDLLDADGASMALSAPSSDRLAAWIGVVQSHDAAAFDRAEGLYKTTGSPVWLVAALMKAQPSHGKRLDPLLRAAASIPRASPAFVTARTHRLRLLSARQAHAQAFREAKAMLGQLRTADGRSARNALVMLAMREAPTLDDMLDHATLRPAGTSSDDSYGVVVPSDEPKDPQLHPEAAQVLSSKLPLSVLRRAASSAKLPNDQRAQVAVMAWVRAVLLGDLTTARALAPTVTTLNPGLAPYVHGTQAAKTRDERHLGLLELLLEAPGASATVSAWRAGRVSPGTIDSVYDSKWWCGSPVAGGNAGNTWQEPGASAPFDALFLTAAERAARDRELRKLSTLGSAPTFLANEAARLAAALPQDARNPKLLHLAVRATRFGCKDAGTTTASQRAFRELHRRYPKSTWAQQTPYYY